MRGYAVFDYLRTYNKKPFLLKNYLKRFRSSAGALHLDVTLSDEEIGEAINLLIEKAGLDDVGIRFLLTGGEAADSFTPGSPSFLILTEKLQEYAPDKHEKGIKLMLHEHLRQFPTVKTTNYITAVKYWPAAKKAGASEILYHYNNKVLEATRSNFFIIKNKTVITPAENILKGITREAVFELASKNYKISEADITLEDLRTADEAFITGTTKKVMPVVLIDDIIINDGAPGPVTRHLVQELDEYIQSCCR